MKRLIFPIILIISVVMGCEKYNEYQGDGLEIYLLKSYETNDSSNEIKTSSIILKNYPIVRYSDIISYDSLIHAFKIIESKKDELQDKKWSMSGNGFAIAINKEIIYSGYFWSGLSSMSCDWIIIDPTVYLYDNSELRVELGYPAENEELLSRDPRNDERIINLLQKDSKLLE